jgi:hypothetical protein
MGHPWFSGYATTFCEDGMKNKNKLIALLLFYKEKGLSLFLFYKE